MYIVIRILGATRCITDLRRVVAGNRCHVMFDDAYGQKCAQLERNWQSNASIQPRETDQPVDTIPKLNLQAFT